MIEYFKEVLKQESLLTAKYCAKGNKVMRPSSIALVVIFFLYLISPYDLIPEYFVKPKAFGYIDDIVFLALAAMYTYSDLEVLLNDKVQPSGIQTAKERDGQDDVSSNVRPSDNDIIVPTPNNSSSMGIHIESLIRQSAISSDDFPNSSPTVSEALVNTGDGVAITEEVFRDSGGQTGGVFSPTERDEIRTSLESDFLSASRGERDISLRDYRIPTGTRVQASESGDI